MKNDGRGEKLQKENALLREQVDALKSELEASICREELAKKPTGGGATLKLKIKKTKFGRILMDPSSKLGKLFRLPRTIYRLIRHPGIIKELYREKTKKNSAVNEMALSEKHKFAPIRFFESETNEKRVNLVVEKLDSDLLEYAIILANSEKCGLRIITCSESVDPLKYKTLVKRKGIEGPQNVEFYSSYDQNERNRVFELEIGDKDIFVSVAKGFITSEN